MFRTSTIIAAVTALLLGLSAVTVTASTDKDPFIGRWKSIDIDGSNQTLTFRRSGTSWMSDSSTTTPPKRANRVAQLSSKEPVGTRQPASSSIAAPPSTCDTRP